MPTNEQSNGYSERPTDRSAPEPSLLRAAPVLARLAAGAWWRATGWTLQTSVRAGIRLARGAANSESPAALFQDAEAELRHYLRELLGIRERDRNGATPAAATSRPKPREDGRVSAATLRERGAELLRRSADIDYDDEGHPAYVQILEQLAPDEARILRLLVLEGPQPSVDVRTGGALGALHSELVAPGLSMIAAQAGCRRPDRLHAYLDNLARLGLIWFSREALPDVRRYQVLEAQPDVAEAMERAGRGRTVRRSIHLTAFGEDFCRAALPLETGEIEALPRQPPEAGKSAAAGTEDAASSLEDDAS